MSDNTPQPKYRNDYQPPEYLISYVDLDFRIGASETEIHTRMTVSRSSDAAVDAPMRMHGREMTLRKIAIDDRILSEDAYQLDENGLTLIAPPASFELATTVVIEPDANTALEGLYRSGDILCTQCEAEGFSRITYFPDRPDVMARYRTRVEADTALYPVLLSNGDCVDSGSLEGGRHYAVYEDPFAKPCYLFALVAGDLACVSDQYRTGSGRDVQLDFYTEHGSEHELTHAVHSLKQAMAWDESVYGLEYDLDSYKVVAVGSFNMGAMENKGLNIFNTACVLASPETATDRDFATVRDVIGHEYFHNYTGNRVTCRDWFQLSLKESLTVYREQQFSADHGSSGVARVGQIRMLRDIQFPEDAGPSAHPVRPESYIEMNNFYTITIYEKGAEVIRMLARLLGREGFVTAVRHYLTKHDGQAATIEDFLTALEQSSGRDLSQFRLWYTQAGTPMVTAVDHFDPTTGTYRLTLRQDIPDTPGQTDKKPMHIPIGLGLLDELGNEIEIGERSQLELTEHEQSWQFEGLEHQPVPSLLRGFSAPVRLYYDNTDEQLATLLAWDSDPVARWDAGQQLALGCLQRAVTAYIECEEQEVPQQLVNAFTQILDAPPDDLEMMAEMLTLPTERYLADQYNTIDVDAVVAAHASLKTLLGTHLADRWRTLLANSEPEGAYQFEPSEVGRRRIIALCLDYLAAADDPGLGQACLERYRAADNMTDRMAALNALRDLPGEARDIALAEFETRGADHALVLNKWFTLHATSRVPNALSVIEGLLEHPSFTLANPNRVRALLAAFSRANMPVFHRSDGAGYRLLADQVMALDKLNPQVAAKMVTPLCDWRRYTGERGSKMQAELRRMIQSDEISSDVREMVDKALA